MGRLTEFKKAYKDGQDAVRESKFSATPTVSAVVCLGIALSCYWKHEVIEGTIFLIGAGAAFAVFKRLEEHRR